MHPENVWKWLDAVDQDSLDPLDQWGEPPPRHPALDTQPRYDRVPYGSDGETYQQYNSKRNAEVANVLKSIPPAGILFRNGSIRATSQKPKVSAYAVETEKHPQSLFPGFPTSFAQDLEKENDPQSLRPGLATNSKATSQRRDLPSTRQLQNSGREGNSDSTNPKRLPTFSERARVRGLTEALHSTPIIHVEVRDPVAVNCQGVSVVGGHQQSGLKNLTSMSKKSRRNTTAGEGALHRSNAIRKPSNVRVEPKARPKY
ncbi:MAG: hypothetical protein Q9175_008130 [Cornicularia normoerica]